MISSEEIAQQVVPHTSFETTCSGLEAAILAALPGSVIFLVGVSGAGKTWARHTVARRLFGDPDTWPRGKIPYVEVMSLLADRGYFSSKDLAISLHAQINAPRIDWLYKDPNRNSLPFRRFEHEVAEISKAWRKERQPKNEREAWREAIDCGRSRGIKVFAIEHASLMAQNRVNGSAVQHTLNLMSVATEMGASIILTTTPEGHALWSKYPEINTRAAHIYINPYRLEIADELKNFATLVKHLSYGREFEPKDLPLLVLSAMAEATQTTPGGIRNIFRRAGQLANAQGKSTIDLRTLKSAFPPQRDVSNILESAQILRDQQTPFDHPAFARSEKAPT